MDGRETDARRGYEPILNAMQPMYVNLIGEGNLRWSSNHRRVAHIAHGWFTRCSRSLDALLFLDRAGHAEEAAPLRRSIIEHVLALTWLAVEGNSTVDTIARGHAFDSTRRRDAIVQANWTSVDPILVQESIDAIEMDRRDSSKDQFLHFAQRHREYGDVHDLPGYLAECAKTHPSYESAAAYFECVGSQPRFPG